MSNSPICTVNGSATTNGVNVSGGATVTIALVDTGGVSQWNLTCLYTDELNSAATVNAGLSVNLVTKTATFTAPAGLGSSLIFQSQINNGRDINGVVQAGYTTTFKVAVLTGTGLRVAAFNETLEDNAGFGWVGMFNNATRNYTGSNLSAGNGLLYSSGVLSINPTQSYAGAYSISATGITLTGTSGNVVIQAGGVTNITFSSTAISLSQPTIQFGGSVAAPIIKQNNNSTNSATGATLTMQAQSCTGTTSVGGNLDLSSGSGTSTNGRLNLQTAASTRVSLGDADMTLSVPALQFGASQASPTISQSTQGSDIATNNLTLSPQAPFASASSNKTPGSLIVSLAAPISGGSTRGQFVVKDNGNTVGYLYADNSGSFNGQLILNGAGTVLGTSISLGVLGVATFLTVNSTGVGLYQKSPVAQASRAGQLTDSTGGAVSSTLAAGITDTNAKNAIASLAAKVNAIELAIHNIGLTA